MPSVLHQVLSLPATIHQAVRLTAMRLVGELSEWIDKHPETLQVQLLIFNNYSMSNVYPFESPNCLNKIIEFNLVYN